jgi:hypothetical protein
VGVPRQHPNTFANNKTIFLIARFSKIPVIPLGVPITQPEKKKHYVKKSFFAILEKKYVVKFLS